MQTLDLAIRDTLAFAKASLDRPGSRILEVGCGRGHLAAALAAAGHEVLAIDASEEAVASARELGVAAEVASFPFFDAEPFDALVFVRSLHHVESLIEAYARAHQLLKPGGLLLVEELGWNGIDRATAEWAYGLAELAAAAELFPIGEWERVGDPLDHWLARHEADGSHTEERVLAEAHTAFEVPGIERLPHFFRVFCRGLEGHPLGAEIASQVLDMESALIAAGAILPLGWRFAARPRPV